ncbi:low molecular weight protein-tyrosine-phosphatase [Litorivivens sp.]|uniref:low molecular weight protein-tyrosine-phosphatase n=1 Tax=Litorivivens sp. TaxID=2020868 RepID=UPI0035668B99
MFNNILFVCTGNICRSPAAEYLLKHQLNQAGRVGITVSSAGLGALVDHPVEDNVAALLSADGIDPSAHRARKISSSMTNSADLILTMESHQLDELHRRYPESRGKCFLLGKWQNDLPVPDPYKRSSEAHEIAYKRVKDGVSAWAKKL